MTATATSRVTISQAIQENSRWDVFLIAFVAVGLILLPTPWFAENLQGRFLFILVLTALGLPTLVALAFSRVQDPRTRLAARVGGGFLLVCLLAAIVGGRFGNSLYGQPAAAHGLVLTTAMLGAWALGKSLHPNATRLLELVLLGCALLNAGVAVVQGLTATGLIADRASGLLDNPVFLAPILVGGMWLAISRASSNVWLVGGCIALMAAAIQTSGSRSALLVLPLIIAGTAWTVGWRLAGVVTAGLVVGLIVGALCIAIGGEQTGSTSRAADTATSGAFTTRTEAWSMATHAIRDRPLLGAGPGRFLAATGKYQTLKMTRAEGVGQQFGDAHNIIIEYTVTTGLIGIALLIAFLVIALPPARWLTPLGGFVVLALLLHLLEPQHALATPAVFFALGAAVPGVVVAAKKPAERQAAKRAERRLMTARAVLVVIALGQFALIALGANTLNRINGSIAAKDVPAASDSLRTAAWQMPFWGDAYHRLAELDGLRAQQLGDPTGTADRVEHLRLAAERQPEFWNRWANLADAQADADDYEGAKASYLKALEANPWAANVNISLAKLLVDHGDDDEARRQLERAVLALPDRTEADALLARLDS